MKEGFGATVEWLPFDLHPEYPPEGIPREQLVARYGSDGMARTQGFFEQHGLEYNPNPKVVPNSMRALRLTEHARAQGLHEPFHNRLMDAYWAEGVDLSQRPALESLAQGVGVSDAAVARALDDRVWARTVDDSTARAQAAGATGVPAFVIDWRLLVVGAQPRELLARAVEQARMSA